MAQVPGGHDPVPLASMDPVTWRGEEGGKPDSKAHGQGQRTLLPGPKGRTGCIQHQVHSYKSNY